jgi:hypothetical protein
VRPSGSAAYGGGVDRHSAYPNGHLSNRGGLRPRAPGAAWTVPPAPLPRLRLTALGSGLFATAAMVLLGALVGVLGGSGTTYGVLFVLVSAAAALWSSPADLFMAPIAAPLTYAVGLLALLPGASDGFGDAVTRLVTALAVHAGWLYGGTLVALGVALARRLRNRSVQTARRS